MRGTILSIFTFALKDKRRSTDAEVESEAPSASDNGDGAGDANDEEDDVDAAFQEYLSPARVLRRMSGIEAPGIQGLPAPPIDLSAARGEPA